MASLRFSPAPSQQGFTLLELLMGAVLLVLAMGGVASSLQVAANTSRRSGHQSQLEALIDQDMAAIEALNDRFTCCPGSCTATTATIQAAITSGSCSTATPRDYRYYAPAQPSGANTTATTNFEAACSSGAIATALVAAFPALPTPAAGANLSRSTPELQDASAQRLRWTYTGSVGSQVVATRKVTLVPAAAAWCP